jgi:hypothetical protein
VVVVVDCTPTPPAGVAPWPAMVVVVVDDDTVVVVVEVVDRTRW